MNICLVSSEYPPATGWGGIGTHAYELSHGLVRKGHKVVVVARALERESVSDDDGVIVHRVDPNRFLRLSKRRVVWRLGRLWDGYNLLVAVKLRSIIEEHAIEIIEVPESRAEGFFVPMMSNLGRCRLIVKLHTGTYFNWKFNGRTPRLGDRLTIFMEKRSVRMADQVISPSQALIDLSRGKGGYLSRKQEAVVVRNPIDVRRFRGSALSDCATGYKPYVFYSGRIEARKGVQTIFDVVPQILDEFPGVTFLFVGADCGLRGPCLERLPGRYRGNVVFLDHMDRSMITSFYKNATVCVFPSIWENFPYTCLEAMASGAPVIGSRSGGMAEMIEEGISGLLVSPQRPEELAEKIGMLLKDEALRKTLGENAARRVREHFSTDVVVDASVALYESVLGR